MFQKFYVIAVVVMGLLDALWLGVFAKAFYARHIGFLMKTDINWVAAIVFYLLFVAGLVVFVIAPSVREGSVTSAVLLGGLFGLIAYATYDLTNLAVVKDWPVIVTVVDMAWGAFIAAAVSATTYFVATNIG